MHFFENDRKCILLTYQFSHFLLSSKFLAKISQTPNCLKIAKLEHWIS